MVSSRGYVGHQRAKDIERGTRAKLFLDAHLLGHFVDGDMTRSLYHHLYACIHRDLSQISKYP